MAKNKRFEVIEHTADIGIKVHGNNVPELFENTALGMFSLLTDLKKIKPELKFEINVDGSDREDLLANWLNDLVYLHTSKGIVLCEFNVTSYRKIKNRSRQFSLTAELAGQKMDFDRTPMRFEIKAATRHELSVAKEVGGYSTRVIFDI